MNTIVSYEKFNDHEKLHTNDKFKVFCPEWSKAVVLIA